MARTPRIEYGFFQLNSNLLRTRRVPVQDKAQLAQGQQKRLDAAPAGHSALTHLAETGVNLPLLMAKSGHENLRSLQKYARPGAEAVATMTAAHDPARRRRS